MRALAVLIALLATALARADNEERSRFALGSCGWQGGSGEQGAAQALQYSCGTLS